MDYKSMNMKNAHQAREIYFLKDNIVNACKRRVERFVFQGGIELDWLNGLRNEELQKDTEEKITRLMKGALDYMYVIGMVMYTFDEDMNVIIVPPEAGDIKYRVNKYKPEFAFFEKNSLEPDPEVFFYIWPDYMPSLDGEFKSIIIQNLELRNIIDEVKDNLLQADFNAARPMLFLQDQKSNKNKDIVDVIDDVTMANIVDPNPEEVETYKISRRNQDALREHAREQNDINMGLSRRSQKRRRYMENDAPIRRRVLTEDSVYSIMESKELTSYSTPKVVADYLAMRREYHEEVCNSFGIPSSLINATSKLKDNAMNIRQSFQKTILYYREAVLSFVRHVYNQRNMDSDKKYLKKLWKLNEELEEDSKVKKQNNGNQYKENKEKLLILADRNVSMEINFRQLPYIDIESIVTATEQNAITPEENRTLIRSNLGLDI